MPDVLDAMAEAVTAAPQSAGLRVQFARLLLRAGRPAEALGQASTALRLDPTSMDALDLVTRAATTLADADPRPEAPAPPVPGASHAPPAPRAAEKDQAEPPSRSVTGVDAPPSGSDVVPVQGDGPTEAGDGEQPADGAAPAVDWDRMEVEVGVDLPAPFVTLDAARDARADTSDLLEVSRETITLADVGGLEQVKKRINEAFLEPMRNQEIARAFGKSLRGGLLLYGPPGTGKTYMARAVAGELGARFLTVTLADILDKYLGESEQNLHDLFQRARQLAPAVLFLDELDAIGGKRAHLSSSSGMRNVVNQLLQEMDGIGSENDGLFVLGATNHPWDVDTALLRPGRFDRVVLVLPPDEPARHAILEHHLKGRPVAGIDLRAIVDRTENFSGADLEHLCSSAAEKAMTASIASGQVRPITMDDVAAALVEVRPSTTAWLQSARNVVTFANNDGRYDELAAYLRARRML